MIRDDYILRLIDQIAAAAAKLPLKKSSQSVEEVRSDLESAATEEQIENVRRALESEARPRSEIEDGLAQLRRITHR